MKQSAVLIGFFIVLLHVLSSCNIIAPEQYEFYYYPLKNIYYNVSDAEYIYSLDGGRTWDSTLALTDKEPAATLGDKHIIKTNAPDIWVHNAEHIQQYDGHAINIIMSDTASQQSIAERKAKKVIKPVTTDNKETEKKPGFFKRLFGKKNK